MEIINRSGVSVYLRLSPAALHSRLITRRQKRPLIRDLSDQELKSFIEMKLAEREPYYTKASFTVRGPDVDIAELIELLRS
jgi:shikimate kinase